MSEDATFEDGREAPLRLLAQDVADLEIVSALTQDAVFPATQMRWQKAQRRFVLLLNRFRWEDVVAAAHRRRPVERVQTLLVIEDVQAVQVQGLTQDDKDMVLSLLALDFEAGEDGMGRLLLTLAGDGAIALEVETLNLTLKDVTQPYLAPSRKTPRHPE